MSDLPISTPGHLEVPELDAETAALVDGAPIVTPSDIDGVPVAFGEPLVDGEDVPAPDASPADEGDV